MGRDDQRHHRARHRRRLRPLTPLAARLLLTPNVIEECQLLLTRRASRRDIHPVRWTESRVVAEGDLVVQFGTREQHWPGGSFRRIEIPSGLFTRDTAFGYRLVDGRISERWAIRDDLGMMLQLGAIVPGRS